MTYLDSRDLDARLDELRDIAEDAAERDRPLDELLTDEEREELAELERLADSGIPDWDYGATLIPEAEFEDYARELASDIGALPEQGHGWPASYIDWERAAEALKEDYMDVEYQGVTYLTRA